MDGQRIKYERVCHLVISWLPCMIPQHASRELNNEILRIYKLLGHPVSYLLPYIWKTCQWRVNILNVKELIIL